MNNVHQKDAILEAKRKKDLGQNKAALSIFYEVVFNQRNHPDEDTNVNSIALIGETHNDIGEILEGMLSFEEEAKIHFYHAWLSYARAYGEDHIKTRSVVIKLKSSQNDDGVSVSDSDIPNFMKLKLAQEGPTETDENSEEAARLNHTLNEIEAPVQRKKHKPSKAANINAMETMSMLHSMISNDKENHQGAIWSNDGTKFEVVDVYKFMTDIVKNLPHTKAKDFSNFKRYLRNYNFISKKTHIWHKEGKFQRDKKDCLKYITKKDTSHVGTQEPRATTENETENEVINSFGSVESNRKRSNSTEAPVQRKKRKPSKAAKGNAMETMSKLHSMISNDKENHQGAIWSNDGTNFEVIDEDKFVTHIVKNLPHTKAKEFFNFKRYLRNYNFTSKKTDIWHKEGKFQRDMKDCLKYITRRDSFN